jgi:multiple sugar transport system permease protein
VSQAAVIAAPRRLGLTPFWFLLPALIVTGAVVVIPVVQTIALSFTNYYVIFEPDNLRFTGLANFAAILHDEVFWISLWHSAIWIIGVVALQFLLGLATALLLNESFW